MSDEIIDEMKRYPGGFFMLICECSHKQSGHRGLTAECERCDCQVFRNTTHIKIGDEEII